MIKEDYKMNVLKKDGFTLIEIIIAMVIIVIVLYGLSVFAISSIKANLTSERMTAATMLARNQIEDTKGRAFDDISNAAGTSEYGSISGYEEFKMETVVSTLSGPVLKTVTVTVFWDSDEHSFQLATAISEL